MKRTAPGSRPRPGTARKLLGRLPALPEPPAWAGRDFRLLVSASLVANIGNAGATIAAAYAVIDQGGSATDVGLVVAARTLALVVFLLLGGAMADRLPRQRVMVGANLLNATSQAAFAVLVLTGSPALWTMAALAAVGGTGQAFFSPASEGMVLSTVDSAHAGKAFSVYRLTMNGAIIGGSALGGALIAAIGPGWVLAVDSAGFLCAAALRGRLRVPAAPRAAGSGSSIVGELREGWREFAARPWLWGIVIQFGIVNAVVTAAETVYGPLVAREHLGGAAPWGLAVAAGGVGTFCGGLLMVRWRPRRMLLAGTLGIFPMALPAAALAGAVSVLPLSTATFVAGVGVEVFAVGWMLALHQEIPEDKMSRVSAYDWLGSISLTPIATALSGPAANAFGRTNALWGCAAMVLLLTGAVLLVPDVRRLEHRPKTVTVPVGPADAAPVPAGQAAAPVADGPAGAPGAS
ncbi:MFS transporter [Actinacidiphila sp. bgisy145]|uniref:MFS transporter n=1 Tax=Actinacidiphila sp. bgisy145 TaxID=3413792 RepID=UPI003EBC6F5C